MKRSLGLLVPLAVVVAVGCGGGDGSLDAILQGERVPPSDAVVDGSAAEEPARDESADAESAEAGDSLPGDDPTTSAAPPLIPGEVEAYCRLARNFDEAGDEFDAAFDTFPPDADLIRATFDRARAALAEIAGVAPDEIRRDIIVFGEGFAELFAELEAVDFNFFALDFEALEDLSDRFDESADRIEEYNERVCGIPRTIFDDDIDLDDFDLGDLEDAFGELGDLFGDLEDFDMGEFGSFFTDMLVQEFLSEGYTQAEAECIAEAIFDFEGLFGAFAEGDPSAFDDIQDPFERCGVTPRD